MERRRMLKHLLLFALIVCAIIGSADGAAQSSTPAPPVIDIASDRATVFQINPNTALTAFYEMTDVEISVALVIIPDPRIPRHRRAYDNAIAAINQGMLRQDYVLDRFGFPWQLDRPQSGKEIIADEGDFGLMLFRQDLWRGAGKGNKVMALYVIPEAGTYGVQAKSFKKALIRIDEQIRNDGKVRTATLGTKAYVDRLVVIGPTFSGALDSVRQIAKSLPQVDYWSLDKKLGKQKLRANRLQHINKLVLVSSSNTVSSNDRIAQPTSSLAYKLYAISDDDHARTIAGLVRQLNIEESQVAFLQEASMFGQGFCTIRDNIDPKDVDSNLQTLCRSARRINFPANIADVRFGMRQKQALLRAAAKLPFNSGNDRLQLEDGAENGSEFPESNQSPLTAVSSQLVLDAVLDSLEASDARVIVVIATDVRDRLFLFEQLRAKFSKALLIDLATDRLLAHPDFLHASRGALSMASAPLQTCRTATTDDPADCQKTLPSQRGVTISAWSTDDQGLLANIVADLDRKRRRPIRKSTPHLVTHHGLVSYQTIMHREFQATWIFSTLLLTALGGIGYGLVKCFRRWRHFKTTSRQACNDPAACMALALPIMLAIFTSTLWISDFYWLGGLLLMISVGVLLRQWDLLKRSYSLFASALVTVGLCALVFVAAGAVWIANVFVDRDSGIVARLMHGVNALPGYGMSYYSALVVALLAATYAVFTQINLAAFLARNSVALDRVRSRRVPAGSMEPHVYDSHLLEPLKQNWPTFILLALLFIAVEVSRSVAQGFKVTPFGALYDAAVWFCVIVTLLFSLNMLLNAIGVARRLLAVGRLIRGWIGSSEKEPLLWTHAGELPAFASTPMLTMSTAGGSSIPRFEHGGDRKFAEWVEQLANELNGEATGYKNHLALYALLAREVFLYQRAIFGVALCSLATAAIVYFYPVSDAEILLLINMGILLAGGIYSGYATVKFEADVILSNVLCNRPSTPHFSAGLFGYVAFPFVILAVVITIADVPGVLDWGGGIVHTLLGAVTPGVFK